MNLPDYLSQEEIDFTARFQKYVTESKDPNIGGAVINCLCSPFGHCYQNHAGSSRWDTISIPNIEDPAIWEAKHKSGVDSYEYHIYTAAERGLAIVGLYLGQPGIGYIYDPFRSEDPLPIRAGDQSEFKRMLGDYEISILGREPYLEG